MKEYYSIAQAICALLHPYGEVVIHDLKTGKIAAIFNNFSKRKVGDDSLLDEKDELPDVFPVFSKVNWDGKTIKSCSATLKDKNGTPIGLFCINMDVSKWEQFSDLLKGWTHTQNQPEVLFKDDWREKINLFVNDFLRQNGTTLKALSRKDKQNLVKALHREGAFKAKHAADYVAEVLDLSRATIYNYLK